MNFIGLDIHKKTISYCVKDIGGKVLSEGKLPATRQGLREWVGTLAKPWTVAMEATMFTGWIYDYLRPHAAAVKVAHPLMLRAIAVAKKKNDRIDAGRIADCLRCDFLPECYMAPMEIRQRRRNPALPEAVGPAKRPVEEQDRAAADGVRRQLQQGEAPSARIFPQGSAREPGDRPLAVAAAEAGERDDRAHPEDGASPPAFARSRPAACSPSRAVDDDPCHRPRHGADLGARSRRGRAVPLRQAGHQLLRSVQRREDLGRQLQAHAYLQAAQSTLADGAVGDRASGSETQPGVGRSLRARSRTEQPQPGYHRRRPQAGSIPSGHRS